MTDHGSGEIPAAATESGARTGVADARIALLAHTRETPASIGVDRGRGPTVLESNVKHRTPEPPPAADARIDIWAEDDPELARLLRLDPTIAKLALARAVKIDQAHKAGMLNRTDSEGRPLYRVTSGGNILRTKPITQRLKRRILNRDGHLCVECSATDRLEIAHIEAYRINGNNEDDNLRTLCADCHNAERGA